jgi:hypothetical protein
VQPRHLRQAVELRLTYQSGERCGEDCPPRGRVGEFLGYR